MKPIKGTRNANKKEIKAIAKFLANDIMDSPIKLYETFDEAYAEYKEVLNKLTAITYKLPKTKGVFVVVINVFKNKDAVHGLLFDKFVEEYLITKDEVKNVTDLDYIESDNFVETPLPFGLALINGDIAMIDENGPVIVDGEPVLLDENPCARIPLPDTSGDINEFH